MALNIRWHNDARNDFFGIVDYFEKEGQIQAAVIFRKRVTNKVTFISKYPGAGRPTAKRKNLKYILVDNHRRLYYRYSSKNIDILAIFDARQDPSKAPF